jgi:sugar lactone lactonase YvrE
MPPHIENPKNLDLPAGVTQVLKVMFADYQRAVIRREFDNSLSGGRVFDVRPIKADGTPELPTIVKLAAVSLIQKEWQAYQQYIRHRLPNVAEVTTEPILLPEIGWGGLRYTLMGGSGTFEVVSLGDYCRRPEVTVENLAAVLERLFRMMHRMWGQNRANPEFHLQPSYDRLLPVSLFIQHPPSSPGGQSYLVKPETLPLEPLEPGARVYLAGFSVTKVDLVNQTITLTGPKTTPTPTYYLRLKSKLVESMASYQVNQIIDPVEGEVIETRAERLQNEIQQVLGQNFKPTSQAVFLPDGTELPNPLIALSTILNETRDVKVAAIHGDFNFENILIEPETGTVSLIDFAEAQEDHVLHDFLRLETEVLTKLVPEILAQHKLPPGPTLANFYQQLHWTTFQSGHLPTRPPHPALEKPLAVLETIRQTARRYLFDFYDPSEYYQGLILYLLGALKFRNLAEAPEAPLPKQVAFWGAATLVKLLETLPDKSLKLEPGARERPSPDCPYRGLLAFREQDEPFFFGREAFTERLIEVIGQRSLVAVVGPSGSGKSSVVQAGLLPRLQRQRLPATTWEVARFTPGNRPFHRLAAAVSVWLEAGLSETDRLTEAQKLGDRLARGEILLEDVVERTLAKLGQVDRLLLVADQFEELFTLTAETERRPFVNSLLTALDHAPLSLLLTLRADFYGHTIALSRELSDRLEQGLVNLGPMTPAELEQVIIEPAHQAGGILEPRVIGRILSDVGQEPGYLPLLEFALTELWAQRRGHHLTLSAYEAVGQVAGAVARRAEATFSQFTFEQQQIARQLFTRLVRVAHPEEGAEDTRQWAILAELEAATWPVVKALADARLVVTGQDEATGQEIVEVAHEALIRGWSRLRQWLDEDRAFLLWRQRLRKLQEQWQASGRDEGALLRGAPLIEAEGWLGRQESHLSQAERDFIQAGLALRQREAAEREAQRQRELEAAQKLAEVERRRAEDQARTAHQLRRRAFYLVGALLLAVVAAIMAIQARDRAISAAQAETTARQEAEQANRLANARALAAFALVEVGQPEDPSGSRALLLAHEAVRIYQQAGLPVAPEVDAALRQAVDAAPPWILYPTTNYHTADIHSAAFSPDGLTIVTASWDQTARLWNAETGQELHQLIGHTARVWSAAFSPNNQTIVTAGEDRTVRLWDVKTGQELRRLTGHTARVWSATVSPAGQMIVTASEDKTARLWDAGTGREIRQLTGHTASVNSAAFSPDGLTIITASWDRTARLWDGETGREIRRLLGHTASVNSAAFSPDGRTIVTASEDRTVRVWDVKTGQEIRQLLGHTASVNSAAFSPDGRTIVTASEDRTVRVWDVETGQEIRLLTGHTAEVNSAAFSPDGHTIVTTSMDKTFQVWPATIEDLLKKAESLIRREPPLFTAEERRRFLGEGP